MDTTRNSEEFAITAVHFDWRRITNETPELARRFYDAMCRCNPYLADVEFEAVYRMMAGPSCRYYHGQGSNFELTVGYQWNNERQMYQVLTIGSVGPLEPRLATACLVDNLRLLLSSTNQTRIFMIEPRKKQTPLLDRIAGCLLWHPALRISCGFAVPKGTYWEVELSDATPAESHADGTTSTAE